MAEPTKLFTVSPPPGLQKIQPTQPENNLFKSNIYVIKLLQMLGILAISQNREGGVYFKWRSLRTIGCAVVSLSVAADCYYVSDAIRELDFSIMTLEEKMFLRIFLIYKWLGLLALAMVHDSGNIANYIEDWLTYQESYFSKTGRPILIDYRKEQLIFFAVALCKSGAIATVATMVLDTHIDLKYDFSYLAKWSIFGLFFVISFLSDAILCLLLFILKGIRAAATDLQIAFTDGDRSPEQLIRYRQMWRELSAVSAGFCDAFSYTIVVFLMFGYMLGACAWYLFALRIGDMRLNAFLCLITTINVLQIPEGCQRTSHKVADLMEREIMLLIRKNGSSEEVGQRQEIHLFETVMYSYPPAIKLIGCFILNRSSVASAYAMFAQSIAVLREIKLDGM